MRLDTNTIPRVRELSERAASEIIKVYGTDFSVQKKSDASPLTDADLKSHEIIVSGLEKLGMGPVVSEEGDYQQQSEDYWLVDPLDGTKDFLHRTDQFAINIAYLSSSVPIFGLILAPVTGHIVWASRGQGVFLNGNPMKPLERTGPLIAAESVFHSSPRSKGFFEENGIEEIHRIGSSLKYMAFVEGRIDVYLRLNPTSEWDTAAGQVIVEEAGGAMLEVSTGRPLVYNKPSSINPAFIVGPRGHSVAFEDREIKF